MSTKTQPIKITVFEPMPGKIFVTELEEGMRLTRGGIIMVDDNMKEHGIKPRWAKVWKVGADVDEVSPGEWVLVEHGRWTLRIPLEVNDEPIDVWMIEPSAMIIVSDSEEAPTDDLRYHL